MDNHNLVLLLLFAATMTFTPGPANLILLGTSLQLGVKRTLPMIMGVCSGFILVAAAVTLGLGALIQSQPALLIAIKISGTCYLLYLAWKLFKQRYIPVQGKSSERPGFISGLVVHPVNPKAWLMLSSAYSQFVIPGDTLATQSVTLVMVFTLCGMLANTSWAIGGGLLQQSLKNPIRHYWVFCALSSSLLIITLMMWF
ncbi:LysE family translocator [Neptunicella marina]|uniref:LysE family translocator n=1 Tax=Neptunicella marina TaxID=2125989 RepID=A0A8J6M192_9ALTE|nr:LysE family translocator [Neptunicella marina]MBC3765308.1 LysE family translocator [Neptunicella marina]